MCQDLLRPLRLDEVAVLLDYQRRLFPIVRPSTIRDVLSCVLNGVDEHVAIVLQANARLVNLVCEFAFGDSEVQSSWKEHVAHQCAFETLVSCFGVVCLIMCAASRLMV